MFNHKHNSPLCNLWNLNQLVDEKLTKEQIQENLKRAVQSVKKTIQQNRNRDRYSPKNTAHNFKLQSRVLLRTHYLSDKGKNFTAKLALKYQGLYRIIYFITPVTVLLQAQDGTGKVVKAHISQLKLCE